MDSVTEMKKKTLVSNVIDFLVAEITNSNLSEEEKESIEVATQCLESAYQVTPEIKDKLEKIDLLDFMPGQLAQELTPEAQATGEHHKNLGNTVMKNGKYEEAVSEYTKAISANPHNAVYYCNRAAAYSRLEKQQNAIQDCKRAIKLDPTYGKAYGRLGIAYSNLNMFKEARDAYETALKFDPKNSMYETNLKLAEEQMVQSMESAAPPQHTPIDISQFINNQSFLQMAREMMNNPEFHNVMSGIMAMSQSGDTNLEALFQAGQSLASRMQDTDPTFVENLRRSFENPNQQGDGADAPPDSNGGPSQESDGKS